MANHVLFLLGKEGKLLYNKGKKEERYEKTK